MSKDIPPSLASLEDDQVPNPVGYKILVALPEQDERFASGLYKPDSLRRDEQTASMLAVVLAVGPDAYKDERRFPSGPWCKAGDTILINPYTGTRLRVAGVNMRLINDDSPMATIVDPQYFDRG